MKRCVRALCCAAAVLGATVLPLAPASAADPPSLQTNMQRADELMKQGKQDEALRVVDAALAQAEAMGNPVAVASVLMLRMSLQTLQWDFPGAEISAKRAFALADKADGLPFPMAAFIAQNTTMLYVTWGRPALAGPWAQRAAAGMEKFDRRGSLHRIAIGWLAIVEDAIGQYAAAQQHREQEIALEESDPKRDPGGLALSWLRLGELRDKRGNLPGAQAAYARALEYQLARNDAEHKASAFATLARIHHALGREVDAQAALERAYAAAGAASGVAPLVSSTSPEALAMRRAASDEVFAWRQIGRIERDRGRHAEAEAGFRRALAMSERMDGPGNVNQPAMLVELGDLLRQRAAWAAAEEAYVGALGLLGQTAGGTAAGLPAALDGLARVRWARGGADAKAALRREIGLYEAYISSDHPNLSPALELLAEILTASGHADEARTALARAAALRELTR